MILEFSVKNYRSIKELQTLSLMAAPLKSKDNELDSDNVFKISDKLSLLKTVAIYGANGSGKSNLVKALIAMLVFIDRSFKDDQTGKQIIEPFAFDQSSYSEPTFFQLVFLCNQVKYRYGFEIKGNVVKSEWLFGTPGQKEVYYFTREDDKIQINEDKFPEGKGLEDKTSTSNLFLNICKAFNGPVSRQILGYFNTQLAVSAGVNDTGFRASTLLLMKEEEMKQKIVSFMNEADFGILGISNKPVKVGDMREGNPNDDFPKVTSLQVEFLMSKRPVFNDTGEEIGTRELLMDKLESDGTLKFFNYSGIILDKLKNGGTLVIDEFDARLHPLLSMKIVKMFNSLNTNKKGAQLIFITHDTNLLDNKLLRRDQIYFTEKNKRSETILYSLADFKGVRNDASYKKDYIKGKYGAIPFLGNFEKLFE